MSLYEDLGVSENATSDEIKKAYRAKASQHHPDKGGKHEDFVVVQKAYEILSDPEKRERYDSTGKENEGPVPESPLSLVTKLMMELIQQSDVEYTDLVQLAREHLKQQRKLSMNHFSSLKEIRKGRKVISRLRSPGQNPVVYALQEKRRDILRKYLGMRQARRTIDACLAVLADWKYEVTPYNNPFTSQYVKPSDFWRR